jgi:Flp pilus assembly protein TadG
MSRHGLPRRAAEDDGVTMIWVALMIVVLLGIGALAVDLGLGYAVKRQLSSTADAAALAGAQEAGLRYGRAGGCGSTLNGAIVSAVNAVHAANAPQGSTGNPTTTITCGADAVTVRVTESSSLPTFLGRILGVNALSPSASATAQVFGAAEQGNGLRPLTVCLGAVQAAYAEWVAQSPASTFQTHFGQHNGTPDGSCNPTGAPGNWGYASFDVGGSQPTLLCLIANGYGPACGGSTDGVDIGTPTTATWSPGNTGNSLQPSSASTLSKMMAQPILLPVARNWRGTGMNAEYEAFGGVGAQICGWVMPKNDGTPQVWDYGPNYTGVNCWDQALYDNAKANWDKVSLVIQWRFVRWVGSYQGQSTTNRCGLGDPTCPATVALIQ